MNNLVGDRATFSLSLWKADEGGMISKVPVVTLEPMYYYESTGMFSLVLTEQDVKAIYDAYIGKEEVKGDYDDLDELLSEEFGE